MTIKDAFFGKSKKAKQTDEYDDTTEIGNQVG